MPTSGRPTRRGLDRARLVALPWHGYDYNPLDGTPPEGFTDAPTCFTTEVRDDGVYVALPDEPEQVRTVSDEMVETMVNWGVTHVFGMVGHSNLGFADAMRKAEARSDLTYIGIRHEGAASFAAGGIWKIDRRIGCLLRDCWSRLTNLMTGLYDAKVDRAPVLAISGQVPSQVRGRGAFQDLDLEAAFSDVASFSETVQAGSNAAELMNLACKTALVERDVAHLMLPDEVQVIPSEKDAGSPLGGRVRPQLHHRLTSLTKRLTGLPHQSAHSSSWVQVLVMKWARSSTVLTRLVRLS